MRARQPREDGCARRKTGVGHRFSTVDASVSDGSRVRGKVVRRPSVTIYGMPTDVIRSLLEGAFPSSTIEIVDRTGGGDHFHVAVTSMAFDGLPLIEQHRLVNRALAGPIGDGTIHELRITTKGTS